MRHACALFASAVAAIVVLWAWLGHPVEMPQSLRATPAKFDCVSYAPFRANQNPFGPDQPIDPRQIDQDLTQLKAITDCVRTYSTDHGLDQIPEIAKRHGLKVIQGLWLSNQPQLNRKQIDTAVALAKRFPDVVQSVVVGNEVLLRGEMSAPALADIIRQVKAQVQVPVTYADVWEYWLRYRELAPAVDFITIHVLPYWEDVPIPDEEALKHVKAIRQQVIDAFPGKEVFLGEFGWPSAGRMREGARPSPAIQARLLQQEAQQGRRQHYRVNVIEAYDQPWKRQLEGTVGGHWGVFDAYTRRPKFTWGAPVSEHPRWPWQAGGGVVLAAFAFAAAWLAMSRAPIPPRDIWWRIGVAALASGSLIGLTVANVPSESLTIGDWLRSLTWMALAIASPIMVSAALVFGVTTPSFHYMLGRRARRSDYAPAFAIAAALGVILIVLTIMAIQAALGLVFDPRYRDFPFAPLLGAGVPLLLTTTMGARLKGSDPVAQYIAAAALVFSTVYIVFNETFANWQALWFCAGAIVLAVTLLRVRDARN